MKAMKSSLIQKYLTLFLLLALTATGCKDPEAIAVNYPDVSIQIQGDPGATEISVTFTPSEKTDMYMFAIGTENDKVNFADKLLPGTQIIKGNEPTTFTFTELDPETYYTLFAVAYDAEGNAGPISMPTYSTYTNNFRVSTYYLTDNSAGFKIETNNDYNTYHFYLGTPQDREAFENNELEGIQKKKEATKWIENYFSLEPDTEYVFYLKGVDRAGNDTKTFEIPVRTAKLDSDEIPNIKFEVTETDVLMSYYTVTPNDKCKMVVLLQANQWLDDDTFYNQNLAAGDFMNILDDWSRFGEGAPRYTKCYIAPTLTNPDKVLHATPVNYDLTNDEKYHVYVLLYDENYKPYAVKMFNNQSPSINNQLTTDKLGGSISISNPTYTTIDVDIKLNDDTFAGFFEIVNGEWLDKLMQSPEFDEDLTIQDIFYQNRATTASLLYSKGDSSWQGTYTDEEMEPDTKYYMVLCPMNENGPRAGGWGKMVMEEFYTKSK